MRSNLENVITQYTVLDKALREWYDNEDPSDDNARIINFEHTKLDNMLHSYVRSAPMYKFHTLWKYTKNAFMFRRGKRR
jgi:hypothetical protein